MSSRRVLAPAAVLFSVMTAHALLETARDALFLAKLGPDRLAWAYLAIAGVAMLAVAAVRRWGGVRDPRRILIGFLVLAALGTTALAVAIDITPSAVFVLYVWTGLVATLVVPCFWTVLDRSVLVGQAKRMFAAIGAGGVLGALFGSALASLLGSLLPASDLVTAGALAFAIATAVAIVLAPHPLPERRLRIEPVATNGGSRRYLLLLVIGGVASTIALTVGDLTFKRVLSERIAADDLATVFGAIYTGLNVIGLVIQLAVTSRLIAKLGVAGALVVLPVILVSTALGFALTGAWLAMIALKLADGGLRHSLHRVATEILFLALPASVRDGSKPAVDALAHRGGQAAAALLVFAVGASGAGSRAFAMVTALAGAAWLVTIAVVRQAYVAQFRDMLHVRGARRKVPDLDAGSVATLNAALASPDATEASAAREILTLLESRSTPTTITVDDLDLLLPKLAEPRLRADARRMFVAAGPRGLARLIDALDDPRVPLRIRQHLPRTISQFRSAHAAAALVARLGVERDDTTEYKLLRALGRMREEDPALAIDDRALWRYAQRAVDDAVRYATLGAQMAMAPVASTPDVELIRDLLAEKARWATEHAFRAFGILYPEAGVRSVYEAIADSDDARRSAAREVFEHLVPASMREPLLAVIDGQLRPAPARTYEALLAALLAEPSASLRCVVAYHVAERHLATLRPELARLRPLTGDSLVVHAYDQALARLDA